ncbi:alpha/beta fold hydrolase [Actibacterium sp. 188UL27-1]|uniref:alpha/beta fold hydrolase n=1 Tax=Actibacterium sp. 188UL27-1 TaxID=2786961 RepID=UPI001959A38E|nr:alpha/beta hydrolase [Actibacterium sp. 188UL27-1]
MIPSVWIHGAGSAGQIWEGFPADLTPDLPGHGAAPRATPPTVDRFAQILLPTLPERFRLVGHSLGGMVALEIAARAPRCVSSLVLIEAVSTVRDTLGQKVPAWIFKQIYSRIPIRWAAKMAAVGQPAQAGLRHSALLGQMSRGALQDTLAASYAYDGRPALHRIQCPTLVLVGCASTPIHRGARRIAETIPGAEFDMLEGGHQLHTDAPQALSQRITTFWQAHPS